MKFKKYQGIGNDFILIDCFEKINYENIHYFGSKSNVERICNRNFGIGSDGIILISPAENDYDAEMTILNSDGTEAEMCGNGMRCLIMFLYEKFNKSIKTKKDYKIKTLAGDITGSYLPDVDEVRVNIGQPIFTPINIPTSLDVKNNIIPEGNITIDNINFKIYAVGMGNPHLVTFVEDIEEVKLHTWGPLLENNKYFPSKTNVHFVQVINDKEVVVKVWERGCGETLACGTGACAVVVTSNILGFCNGKTKVNLKGGHLYIDWNNTTKNIYMTGKAKYVYEGKINIDKFI